MGCCTPAGDEGLEGEVDDPSLNEDDPAAVLLNMASLAHTQQPSDMPAGLAGAAALMHTAPPPGAGDGAAAAAAAQTVEAQTRSGLVYAQVCRQRRRRVRACGAPGDSATAPRRQRAAAQGCGVQWNQGAAVGAGASSDPATHMMNTWWRDDAW